MEHISMFASQLGEVSAYDFMKVCNFPLALTSTTFAWFTSLTSCSIGSWAELEENFVITFIMVLMKLDCLTFHWFVNGMMS